MQTIRISELELARIAVAIVSERGARKEDEAVMLTIPSFHSTSSHHKYPQRRS